MAARLTEATKRTSKRTAAGRRGSASKRTRTGDRRRPTGDSVRGVAKPSETPQAGILPTNSICEQIKDEMRTYISDRELCERIIKMVDMIEDLGVDNGEGFGDSRQMTVQDALTVASLAGSVSANLREVFDDLQTFYLHAYDLCTYGRIRPECDAAAAAVSVDAVKVVAEQRSDGEFYAEPKIGMRCEVETEPGSFEYGTLTQISPPMAMVMTEHGEPQAVLIENLGLCLSAAVPTSDSEGGKEVAS